MKKVFIDGGEGTTGLKLAARLQSRNDIELISIDEEKRKDPVARAEKMNTSDFVFLCLPDAAAIEAVSLIENEKVKVLDASTAHRTNKAWAYGFPELSVAHRDKIASSKRVAVPGCYAGGMLSLLYPLIAKKAIQPDYPFSFFGLSGYTGGGKKMIAQYQADNRDAELDSPRQYALSQEHKHLAEVTAVSGIAQKPLFVPIVCNYPCGMTINLSLYSNSLLIKGGAKALYELFSTYYGNSKMIKVMPFGGEGVLESGFLASNTLAECDDMQIFVAGNDERITLVSRFDNLGKGASGAAVQAMNIMMGIDEATGLIISK